MKYTNTGLDSSIALAMIKQALASEEIKVILGQIATTLREEVLSRVIEKEAQRLNPNLHSLALQHSKGDKFIGALLPEDSPEYLEQDQEGRDKLLEAINQCLMNAEKVDTIHEFLALMKTIDGMACMYDILETEENNPQHALCKEYISPTKEESMLREKRAQPLFATTYGIGSRIGEDLVTNSKAGALSGKALFFIRPAINRKPIWFEKLARQATRQAKVKHTALPLVATVSNSTAKNFIMAHGLDLFRAETDIFDFNQAQIFANCFMAYIVYCGHHSLVEVVEVWNRLLDYLVIEHPEKLGINIATELSSKLPYIKDPQALERRLPYAIIGNSASFLHASYVDAVMRGAVQQLKDGLDLHFEMLVNNEKVVCLNHSTNFS